MKMKVLCPLIRVMLLGLLFLALPILASCAGQGTGISLGAGSGGVGVGMHSGYYPGYGYGWPGLAMGYGHGHRHWGRRHYGGVMMSLPVTSGPGYAVGFADYPVGERYPVRRAVPLPNRGPITEASHADWKRYDDLYHSPLQYYRGRSFLRKR